MRYFYLILLLLFSTSSFAQTPKIYITNNGHYSVSPENAASYLLIQKNEGDSVYHVRQYDMKDTIEFEGSYKDSLLTIEHGKFEYYHKKHAGPKAPVKIYMGKPDTNNYIQSEGFFLNGDKTGMWTEYDFTGERLSQTTFKNGKIEGVFRYYDNSLISPHWSEGYIKKGLLEGRYAIFNKDSVLIYEANYQHSEKMGEIFLEMAKPNYNFQKYLEKNLKSYSKELSKIAPIVELTTDSTGKITNVKFLEETDSKIVTALTETILNAQPFIPAKFDNLPIRLRFTIVLFLFSDTEIAFELHNYNPNNIQSGFGIIYHN
jgi:antitoxin component YwqK of YwqJK toxin-antitoxin module